jgi:DNA repair protein SbcD/Mre11
MARFFHIADLHLGRTLHQVRLLDDQRRALEGVLAAMEASAPRVDALLIAGDVYDRSVPPTEAVNLLKWFIHQVAIVQGVQVVMIPGNHDSAERMGFTAGLTREILHIAPPITAQIQPLVLQDAHGPIDIFALPFLDPPLVREVTGDETVRDHGSATQVMVERMVATSSSPRRVLVAHAFVNDAAGSAAESDSERLLYVGGSEAVNVGVFKPFDYVALGHLHRPQRIGSERVQYSGSLLKYSKSEADHSKSLTVIDMGPEGEVETRRVPLQGERDLRVLRGSFDEVMAMSGANRKDYLFFELTNENPVSDVMNRLRERYPNAVHLCYLTQAIETALETVTTHHNELSVFEHFGHFFELVTGNELGEERTEALIEVLAELGDDMAASS